MSKVRVLLVDDRPENLLALEATLAPSSGEGGDYELVKAQSGAAALRYLLDHDCAIILLDVQMPDMDGFETADLIKQNPKLRDIPIVFLTALTHDQRFVDRGYAAGAVDYISKPIVPEYLRAKVAVFAQLHRSRLKIVEQQQLLLEHERKEQARVRAELELAALRREQALHRRYRELVNGMRHAIVWVADPASFALTFVSPSAGPMTARRVDVDAGDTVVEALVHPDDRADVMERLRALRPDHAEVFEHRLLRADGETLWMRTVVRREQQLVAAGAEQHDELRGLSVDVTETALAERTLRQLSRIGSQLAETLDADVIVKRLVDGCVPELGDGCVAVVDDDGAHRIAAESWASPQLAQQAAHLVSLPSYAGSPFDPTAAPAAFPDVDKLADNGNGNGSGDRALKQALAALGAGSFASAPIAIKERVVGGVALWSCTNARPVDERAVLLLSELARRAGLALEHAVLYRRERDAVAHRDEFLSVASHELRTPLTPLKIGLQSSIAKLDKLEKAHEGTLPNNVLRNLQVADRQVDRLQLLVDSLLDVSRIRTGRLALEREQLDLAVVVRDVVTRFQPELARKDLRVDQHLESVIGHWDRNRLDQVVSNLLANAVKYGDGKPIELSVSALPGSRARIDVVDQGLGIAAADRERIFDRFERAASAQNYGGLGLGLYIARQIVRAHGGIIGVDSEPGRGSRFYVELPVEPPAATTGDLSLSSGATSAHSSHPSQAPHAPHASHGAPHASPSSSSAQSAPGPASASKTPAPVRA